MAITLQCPCGKTLKVGEQHRGKKAKCPECGNLLLVPEAETAVQAEAPPKPKPAASASNRSEKSAEPAKRNMLPWYIGGGCALLALFGCMISAGLGGWAMYARGQAEKKRVDDFEKEAKRQGLQRESETNLKQIMLALHNYHDVMKRLPNQAHVNQQTGQPLLSWRVLILPYLEQEPVFRAIRLDEPWDSAHNRQYWDKMPTIYQLPGKPNDGKTYYQGFAGERMVFFKPREKVPPFTQRAARNLVSITDGTSNTIGVIEAAEPVNWMKPDDIPFDANPGGVPLKVVGNHWGDDTFHAAFFDGFVRRMKRSVPPLELQKLVVPDDGMIVDPGGWDADGRR